MITCVVALMAVIALVISVPLLSPEKAQANSPENHPVRHFTGPVLVPAWVQRTAAQDRLHLLRQKRDLLMAAQPELADKIMAEYREKIAFYTEVLKADDFKDYHIEAEQVHIGSHSIYYTGRTFTHANMSRPKDPVNLVFYDQASRVNVEYQLFNSPLHAWDTDLCFDILNDPHWVGMKNNARDNYRWVRSRGYNIAGEHCSRGIRHHVRVFYHNTSDGHFGTWALGSAHREKVYYFNGSDFFGHTVLGWDDAERIVRDSLIASGRVLSHRSISCPARGKGEPRNTVQGVRHDGLCSEMRLRTYRSTFPDD